MQAKTVELLAVSGGRDHIDDKPIVMVTVRLDNKSFKPTGLVFSKEQAEKLLAELQCALISPLVACG